MRGLFLIFLLAVNCALGQENIDSLESVFQNAKLDSVKIKTGLIIMGALTTMEPLKTIEMGQDLRVLIQNSGSINEDQRMQYSISCGHSLALAYNYVGDNKLCVENYLEILEHIQKIGDFKRERNVLMNLGASFSNQGMKQDAMEYFRKALNIAIQHDEVYGIAMCYGNIGTAFTAADRDSTIYYYKLSLEAMKRDGMTDREGAMGWMLNNIGSWHQTNGNLDSALFYYKESLRIRRSIDHRLGMFIIHRDLAELNAQLGNISVALAHIDTSIAIGESNGFVYALDVTYRISSEIKRKQGDFRGALKDYMRFIELRDSSENVRDAKDLVKQTISYDYEKKLLTDSLEFSKKEAVFEERTQKQRVGLIGAGAVLILVIVLAYTIYSGKKRSDELLLNILPEEVAEELKAKGHSDAQLIELVTVLFTDFKGFTALSEQVTPRELVKDLHECFSEFDRICGNYGVEKIKTIGDAYMAAGGLPSPNNTHAMDVVSAALEMAQVIAEGKKKKQQNNQPYFEIRIGVHTGPVVAGIVGVKKFQYDIWGDTVNTASRMESSGEVGKVNISQSTYELIKDIPGFVFEKRGRIQAKGKGELEMYFVSKA
ncbi:MAG: adenylate/guanylate cyclase domain-containing protein [Bacteroidia bacterium]